MLNGSATLTDISNTCTLSGKPLVGTIPEYRVTGWEQESVCQVEFLCVQRKRKPPKYKSVSNCLERSWLDRKKNSLFIMHFP